MKEAINREHWLQLATAEMIPWFKDFDAPTDISKEKIQVSCGFTKSSGPRDMAIGQCWYKSTTVDESKACFQIFICPTQDDPIQVLGILLHEMIHVACGPEHGHKGAFKDIALKLGLAGKMTATFVDVESELHERIDAVFKKIGPYPHSSMAMTYKKKTKQKGKWIRLMSLKDETYTCVISPKSLENHGYPTDPWGEEMVEK